jgi:hypothetical protein
MSRVITTIALFCLAIAIGMGVLKWNESSATTAENPMLTPQNSALAPAGTPGQPAVIEQRLPPDGMAANRGVTPYGSIGAAPGVVPYNSSAPAPALTVEHPTYATPQEVVTQAPPEKVIIEKRVVYVRPRNRFHIGRTVSEMGHYVFNLPNRLWGP